MEYQPNANRRKLSRTLSILILSSSLLLVGFSQIGSDYFQKISKSIDVFGRVYKELTMNYVDEVDPEKLMEAGIDGLLGSLDPYTTFISPTEGDEVELITTGKYGGIGVTIGVRDGFITIITLMEGYTAQRQGLQPGDRLIEVNGKSVVGKRPEDVRSMTRGEPGTEVRIKIEREDEPNPLDFVLVREEIQLHNLAYADFVTDGIAYVRLDRFSRGAGDELRLAIKDLKLKGTIRSLILDLRDNPGGLLDVAVNVVEKFVPKGSMIVSTRGRKPESEKKYFATEEPMLADVPIVVLVNRNSASASEIVAGAIQDLDRGIILGTRTFGKGLVQTIAPLVYGAQLKITTAKYYTPSGRCIQEIDYMHKGKDGVFAAAPDSAKHEFRTLKGRKQLDLGGIAPDTVLEKSESSALNTALLRKSMYFKFATRYASLHHEQPRTFVDDSLLHQLDAFLKEYKFTYRDDGETKIEELKEIGRKSKYDLKMMEEIDRLQEQLTEAKATALERHKTEVLAALKPEIMSRYKGEKGRIEASLSHDMQVKAAIGLLTNKPEYSRRLTTE